MMVPFQLTDAGVESTVCVLVCTLQRCVHSPHLACVLQIATNHLGHALLIFDLLSVIEASAPSRIVLVASDMHEMVYTTSGAVRPLP